MKKLFTVLLLFVLSAFCLRAEELIVNGKLNDLKANGLPRGWVISKMPANVPWTVSFKDGIFFVHFHDKRGYQGRIMQTLKTEYDQKYQVSFEYRSNLNPKLHADVLLVNSGPIYRSLWLSPRKEWTKRKFIFMRSSKVKSRDFIISVQNRSMVPVWFRNISVKKVSNQTASIPRFITQPVAPNDQMRLPGDNKKYLEFVINPISKLKNYRIEASLFNSKGKIAGKTTKLKGNRIKIKAAGLTDNLNTLVVNYFDKKDGAQVWFNKLEIEKVPASEFKSDIAWDKHAVIKTREDKAVFPIMMFEARPSDFDELKANGFNTMHSYGFESEKRTKLTNFNRAYLRAAEAKKLYVALGMPRRLSLYASRRKQFTKWVRDIKDFPAGLFYYSDEMLCIKKAPESAFAMIKQVLSKEDPKRMWFPYDPPAKLLSKYVDGIMFIGSENTIRLTKLRVRINKPFIHCFGHVDFRAPKASSEKYIAYNLVMSVIFGARGISYWWYPAIRNGNGEPELLKKRLFRGTRALAKCAPAIVSPKKEPDWCSKIKTSGGVRILKAIGAKKLWILVGVPNSSKPGTLTLPVNAKSIYGISGAGKNYKFASGEAAIIEVEL